MSILTRAIDLPEAQWQRRAAVLRRSLLLFGIQAFVFGMKIKIAEELGDSTSVLSPA